MQIQLLPVNPLSHTVQFGAPAKRSQVKQLGILHDTAFPKASI